MTSTSARLRSLLLLSMTALLVGSGTFVPPASAALRPVSAPADERQRSAPVVPETPHQPWDGSGITMTVDPRLRQLVADIAAMHEVASVRQAAAAALAADDAAIMTFLEVTQPKLQAQEVQRLKKVAADNLKAVTALRGTGGTIFNAEVERALAGTDANREAFLAYGSTIARDRDEQTRKNEQDRKAQLRERLQMLAGAVPAGSQLKLAADAALAGDDAAVATFWEKGYLEASAKDAAAREQHLKDLEARNKAAEQLSDLAKRAARAAEARKNLLAAHGDGVDALQRVANEMIGAANAAREAERILAGTSRTKSADLQAAKNQAAAFLRNAEQQTAVAQSAAVRATNAADDLVDTGLTYGAEWARITTGLHEAAKAAVGATLTATHAIDATIATHNAKTAQEKAEAHARKAKDWRTHAEDHAKAARRLADAAKVQAEAAKTAAARTKAARIQAEKAEAEAKAAADRAAAQRKIAEDEAKKAKAARRVAETERANAAAHRNRAEEQAAIARNQRAYADAQAAAAQDSRVRADAADDGAATADRNAARYENDARVARDAATQARRDKDTARAKANALKGWAAEASAGAERDEAQRQADVADREAGSAEANAANAQSAANRAGGAAASSRASAVQAQQAANRAWAAAEQARVAAKRADAAADKAEAEARATHAARLRADAKAAQATADEAKAAEAANAATRLAQDAADEAVRSLWAAERTREEADAAAHEAVAAAVQADVAVQAAVSARASSSGIAAPHDTAIAVVSPFTGADIDADYVVQVVEQAKSIGAEQVAAANRRADEAVIAAQKASDAAKKAAEQVKPAFEAAAAAAAAAADAARSAAEAKQAAAQAAVDGAAARQAAANAAKHDDRARKDAAAARTAANEAARDAEIARRSASAAQQDANRASSAASAAEADAAAAQEAARRADVAAKAARSSANSAEAHAESAAAHAANALQYAVEGQKQADLAEQEERQREADLLARAGTTIGSDVLADLTPAEQDEYRRLLEEANKGFLDFIKEEGLDFLKGLIVPEDLEACIRTPNFKSCFWTIIDLIPWGKLRKLENIWDLYKKFEKFSEKIRAAKKRLDDLAKKARKGPDCDGDEVALAKNRSAAKDLLRTGAGTRVQKGAAELRAAAKACDVDPEFPSIPLTNYRGRYKAWLDKNGYKKLPDDWDAHHAIPQEYRNHPEFKDFDFDAPSNMRGLPGSRMKSRPANVHQDITDQWRYFKDLNPNPTRAQIEEMARQIDRGYGAYYWQERK
jgi:hypothetical protein